MSVSDADFSDLAQRLMQHAHRRYLAILAAGVVGAETAPTARNQAARDDATQPPPGQFRFDRELGSLVDDHPELLMSPGGVATDAAGNLHVLEWGRNRIARFGPDGVYQRQFGARGNGNGQFDDPGALAIDRRGCLYVADVIPSDFGSPHRIQVLTPHGDYLARLGAMQGDHLEDVSSMAVARNGHVFVSGQNSDGTRGIYEWDATFAYVGRRVTLGRQEIVTAIAIDRANRLYAGCVRFAAYPFMNSLKVYALSDFSEITALGRTGSGEGEFESFAGIAADADGAVYVSDADNARVQRLTWDGGRTALAYAGEVTIAGSVADEFGGPGGVAIGNGCVYVVDYANACVRQFSPALAEQGRVGEPGVGQFLHPEAATSDADGNVYVLDNNVVHKLTGQGTAVRKWGGYGSGPTEFRFPGSLAFSPANELYVADSYNARIQVYSPDGDLRRSLTGPQLARPVAVAFAADGSYVVANEDTDDISLFTANDVPDGRWQATDIAAGDLAVDHDGRIYVAAASDDVVRVYLRDGAPQGSFATPGPGGVAVGADGCVVVASCPDDANAHVFVRDRTGAPVCTVGAAENGPGAFSSPVGVHLTSTGALLVTDLDNGVLRFTCGVSSDPGHAQAGEQGKVTRRQREGKRGAQRQRGQSGPGRLSPARSSSRRE